FLKKTSNPPTDKTTAKISKHCFQGLSSQICAPHRIAPTVRRKAAIKRASQMFPSRRLCLPHVSVLPSALISCRKKSSPSSTYPPPPPSRARSPSALCLSACTLWSRISSAFRTARPSFSHQYTFIIRFPPFSHDLVLVQFQIDQCRIRIMLVYQYANLF